MTPRPLLLAAIALLAGASAGVAGAQAPEPYRDPPFACGIDARRAVRTGTKRQVRRRDRRHPFGGRGTAESVQHGLGRHHAARTLDAHHLRRHLRLGRRFGRARRDRGARNVAHQSSDEPRGATSTRLRPRSLAA